MLRKLFICAVLFLTASMAQRVSAQEVAIKTNVAADALLNVNLGAEVGLAPKWSLDATAEFNGWNLSHGRRWKHWYLMPEARYWFCQRMGGHFLAAHVMGGQYNIGGFDGKFHFLGTDARKLKDTRYQGWYAGAGIGYGYAWMLSPSWNLEAELGVGYAFTRYDRFKCANCGKKIEDNRPHNYWGITKAAINIVYIF
ncbi:MAG: DUF3575 domain-containing protein [Duncaniella sp.]|nr:DUF3575 domain-containing protein [Muribaculum sp.]MCM1255101.1 DUF3575 domain-containing protein [Duncaniella sp.]